MSTTYWIFFVIAGFLVLWVLFSLLEKSKIKKKKNKNIEEDIWSDDQDKFG